MPLQCRRSGLIGVLLSFHAFFSFSFVLFSQCDCVRPVFCAFSPVTAAFAQTRYEQVPESLRLTPIIVSKVGQRSESVSECKHCL